MKINPERKILSPLVAYFLAVLAGIASFIGSSSRPDLVPDPLFASVVVGVCFSILLLPFLFHRRKISDIFSPAIMGGGGYLIYIGIGAVTNHAWPGFAVNPDLFDMMPVAIIAQTLGAMAFYFGTRLVIPYRLFQERKTNFDKLALVLVIYAAVSAYISFLIPKIDPLVFRSQVLNKQDVSWLYTTGTFVVMHSLTMGVACISYLKRSRFAVIRWIIAGTFGLCAVLFMMSGSRTYSAEILLLIFIAYIFINKNIPRWAGFAVPLLLILIFSFGTILRLTGSAIGNISPSTVSKSDLVERVTLLGGGAMDVGYDGVMENFHENIVYHLSDNQTMAMLFKNSQFDLLLGDALLNSLYSALPSTMRPDGYQSTSDMIMNNFGFVKQMTMDAFYEPDWQISAAVWGYADFGLFGLMLFPFIMGAFLRLLYNWSVLQSGLGIAGWLAYIPLIHMMWSPMKFGPEVFQELRLVAILFIALWFSSSRPVDHYICHQTFGHC